MKRLLFLFFLLAPAGIMQAQNPVDTLKKVQPRPNADDPSQFFTRIELFNELQRYDKTDIYVNQTVLRSIFKIGKRFTTRIDLPYVYNSLNTPANHKQSGIGDISFRLVGYKFLENPKSAFTASIEVSLNTAQSPLLGTGKNILIPVVSYTKVIPKKKMLLSLVFQQTNSVSGDKNRSTISFSKLQVIAVKYLSKRSWVVLAPEWFLDYVHGGLSMNLRSRFTHAPAPRINIWITPSAGIFGDFAGRYQLSLDIGARFFLLREMNLKKKQTGK
jgi:hypothetical protein